MRFIKICMNRDDLTTTKPVIVEAATIEIVVCEEFGVDSAEQLLKNHGVGEMTTDHFWWDDQYERAVVIYPVGEEI